MRKHYSIRVSGFVQGVFFRYSAKAEAEKLGLTGFAENLDDGSVQIEAEGEEKNLELFLEWCRKGPPLSEVEKIHCDRSKDIESHRGFETR